MINSKLKLILSFFILFYERESHLICCAESANLEFLASRCEIIFKRSCENSWLLKVVNWCLRFFFYFQHLQPILQQTIGLRANIVVGVAHFQLRHRCLVSRLGTSIPAVPKPLELLRFSIERERKLSFVSVEFRSSLCKDLKLKPANGDFSDKLKTKIPI